MQRFPCSGECSATNRRAVDRGQHAAEHALLKIGHDLRGHALRRVQRARRVLLKALGAEPHAAALAPTVAQVVRLQKRRKQRSTRGHTLRQ